MGLIQRFSYLSLQNSWDYRCEAPHLAPHVFKFRPSGFFRAGTELYYCLHAFGERNKVTGPLTLPYFLINSWSFECRYNQTVANRRYLRLLSTTKRFLLSLFHEKSKLYLSLWELVIGVEVSEGSRSKVVWPGSSHQCLLSGQQDREWIDFRFGSFLEY
jgi:hypothetical protein